MNQFPERPGFPEQENRQPQETPSVAAIIPCHNHAAWVCDAVGSVVLQDYRPLRVVVVDDGSRDKSFEAVVGRLYRPQVGQNVARGRWKDSDVEVEIYRSEQAHGPSAARNFGMSRAPEADLYALLDSDDLYLPGKLSRSVACFARSPHVGVVYSDFDTVRPDGLRLRQYKEPFDRTRLLQECLINCDSLVSRAAIEAVGGFDTKLRVAEDYDLWLRLTERFVAVHLPEPLVLIRVGGHSSTATVQSTVWQDCWRRVMQKTRERAGG